MPFSRSKFTGFPFDESDYESDNHFQARLNDIASRHPEFATHFRGFDDFPSLRRKRHTSGSSGEPDDRSGSSAGPSHRFADHSFPSGFNRFPFTRHFEEDFQEPNREDKPPEVPKQQEKRGRKPNPYLPQHLSNTVDLGQKQTPEVRSQRSMSAPPENRAQSSRVEQEPSNEEQPQPQPPVMGKTFSQQPKERIIPIHVEGRDDPVLPKNPNLSSGGSTEKIPPRQQDPHAQFRRQAYEQFVPQNQPQARQQTPPAHQPTPPRQQSTPPPPPQSNDPLDKIKSVRSDVMELMTNVEKFDGTRKDREYLYLDEMLTRNLLKLDNIDAEGKENIRLARKEAIKCITTCIGNLEAKAQAKEMALKNQQSETTKSSSETSIPSDPPKFTSQATLIISPPKAAEQPAEKPEEQPSAPAETMEVEPPVESKESTETTATASTETTDSQSTETIEPASSESSQTADTTQNN